MSFERYCCPLFGDKKTDRKQEEWGTLPLYTLSEFDIPAEREHAENEWIVCSYTLSVWSRLRWNRQKRNGVCRVHRAEERQVNTPSRWPIASHINPSPPPSSHSPTPTPPPTGVVVQAAQERTWWTTRHPFETIIPSSKWSTHTRQPQTVTTWAAMATTWLATTWRERRAFLSWWPSHTSIMRGRS